MFAVFPPWKKRFKSLQEFRYSLSEEQNILFETFHTYSNLSYQYLFRHINRTKGVRHADEYAFKNPKGTEELDWFYRTNEKYIFSLFTHEPWKYIGKIEPGKILDYGAGIGIDTLTLLKKEGYAVDFFDINILQSDFMRFLIHERQIDHVRVLSPFVEGRFDSIACIRDSYDGVLLRSVLEHVPYYDRILSHLAGKVVIGGRIYEASRFGKTKKDPMHIDEHTKITDVMNEHGFVLEFQEGVHHIWKKTT